MILTALVQTKGGTLVVDLPRDRIDLEMKIRSVGIERLSDQIRIIDDEEKSDISVKLFGESDIGRHLSLLFNENHTLFEVNKTLQFVANSVEDIRDDLEMNIIHDQYDTPAELVGDIERMTSISRLSAIWRMRTTVSNTRSATAISVTMNMRFASCFKKSRISTART